MFLNRNALYFITFLVISLIISLKNDISSVNSIVSVDYLFYIFICYCFFIILNDKLCNFSSFFSPWIFYPILVTLYYLLEPLLGGALIGAKDPRVISQLTFYYIISFLVGCSLAVFIAGRKKVFTAIRINHKTLFQFSVAILLISLIIHIVVIARFGFLPLRPDFEIIRTELPQHISGYATYLMYLSTPSAIIFFTISTKTKNTKLKYLCFLLGTISAILPLHTGNRTRFLVSVIVPLLIFWSYRSSWPKTWKIFSLVTIGLIIMGVIGAIRLSSFMTGSLHELAFIKLSSELGLGPYSLDLIVSRTQRSGEFVSLSWLFSPISSLLPGQDVTLVRYLKDFFNLAFVGGGFTPTIIGSFYIYGGNIAVILGGVIYGYIQSLVAIWFFAEKNMDSKFWKSVLFYLNFIFLCITVKNGFFISIEYLFYVCTLITIIKLSRLKVQC